MRQFDMDLPALVQPAESARVELTQHWRAFQARDRQQVKAARLIGQILTAHKERIGHGGWTAWLKDNAPFSAERAREFMRIHEHWEACQNAESVWEAREIIAKTAKTAVLDCDTTQESATGCAQSNDEHIEATPESEPDEAPEDEWPEPEPAPSRSPWKQSADTSRNSSHRSEDRPEHSGRGNDAYAHREQAKLIIGHVPADPTITPPGEKLTGPSLTSLVRKAISSLRASRDDVELVFVHYGSGAPGPGEVDRMISTLLFVERECVQREGK